jgi:hypothetical protein
MKDAPISCESAAVRVQCWFKKDKIVNDPTLSSGEFYKKYKCNPVKMPRIPRQVGHLSFQGYLLTKKKKQTKGRCVTRGNPLKPLGVTIDTHPVHCKDVTSGKALTSKRVANCKSKEHLFASKRLKNTSAQHAVASTRYRVVPIKSSSPQDPSHPPHRIESDRHFLLCAIPMYPVFKDELKRN